MISRRKDEEVRTLERDGAIQEGNYELLKFYTSHRDADVYTWITFDLERIGEPVSRSLSLASVRLYDAASK